MAEKKKKKIVVGAGDKTDPLRKEASAPSKPALGQGSSGRPSDKFKFKSTGQPTKSIGGREVSPEEFKQEKRKAKVEVATGKPFEPQKEEAVSQQPRAQLGDTIQPQIITEGTGITKEEKEQDFGSKALDIIAAPLSQPSATLAGGITGGAAAVRESRGFIEEGTTQEATSEAGSVALTAVISTGLAVGGLLTGVAGALALTGKLAGAAVYATAGLTTLYGIDKVFYSPGELANWAAVDNVVSALGFQSKEITKGINSGDITRENGQASFEQMLNTVNDMRAYVRTQTARNPKMYASGKIFLEAINTGENGILQQYNILTG